IRAGLRAAPDARWQTPMTHPRHACAAARQLSCARGKVHKSWQFSRSPGKAQARRCGSANEMAAFWNPHSDRRYAETLLQRDDKGVLFIDYLRIVADEFVERQEYRAFLSGHARLIAERLERHKDNEGVR